MATVLTRESEYWGKLEAHSGKLQNQWNDLSADRKIKGLPWPSIDFDDLGRVCADRQKHVLQLMAIDSCVLALHQRSPEYPDFAGQFLHSVGEALFEAMYANDATTVETLFKPFFISTLLQFNYLRPKSNVLDWRATTEVKVAVAPLLDLMDLSGYAYFYSEFHNNPAIRDAMENCWNDYFDGKLQNTTPMPMDFWGAAVSISEGAFELAHRSVLRNRWQQMATVRCRSLGRVNGFEGSGYFDDDAVVQHSSALVRLFAASRASFHDGIDVFILNFVRRRPDGAEVVFGGRRQNLQETLDWEAERYEEKKNEDKDI
jgi:hypothetical protein